jgi:hypothetical protein
VQKLLLEQNHPVMNHLIAAQDLTMLLAAWDREPDRRDELDDHMRLAVSTRSGPTVTA